MSPRQVDDIEAASAVAGLTPTARQEYANRQLIQLLESKNEQEHATRQELNELKVAHATLQNSHRSARWIGAVCAVSATAGGALISTYSATGGFGLGLGWSLIGIACVVQIAKSGLDW